jgi:hypothetical protein
MFFPGNRQLKERCCKVYLNNKLADKIGGILSAEARWVHDSNTWNQIIDLRKNNSRAEEKFPLAANLNWGNCYNISGFFKELLQIRFREKGKGYTMLIGMCLNVNLNIF